VWRSLSVTIHKHLYRQGMESDGSDWHLLWRDGFVWRSLSIIIHQRCIDIYICIGKE